MERILFVAEPHRESLWLNPINRMQRQTNRLYFWHTSFRIWKSSLPKPSRSFHEYTPNTTPLNGDTDNTDRTDTCKPATSHRNNPRFYCGCLVCSNFSFDQLFFHQRFLRYQLFFAQRAIQKSTNASIAMEIRRSAVIQLHRFDRIRSVCRLLSEMTQLLDGGFELRVSVRFHAIENGYAFLIEMAAIERFGAEDADVIVVRSEQQTRTLQNELLCLRSRFVSSASQSERMRKTGEEGRERRFRESWRLGSTFRRAIKWTACSMCTSRALSSLWK